MRRRWQPYRGTLAWLAQRVSALALFVLVPIKIYSGYGTVGKLPWFAVGDSAALHVNAAIDVSLLFFLLVHMLYGLRVILIDVGWIREDSYFWRTSALAATIFLIACYYLYLR
ncbi:MAG: hypothetical protein LC737_04650 [Chloroflexi bacterium]|nr:hypothetical protein [Chloroflexota bacterium]